jgi:hypothetical protein
MASGGPREHSCRHQMRQAAAASVRSSRRKRAHPRCDRPQEICEALCRAEEKRTPKHLRNEFHAGPVGESDFALLGQCPDRQDIRTIIDRGEFPDRVDKDDSRHPAQRYALPIMQLGATFFGLAADVPNFFPISLLATLLLALVPWRAREMGLARSGLGKPRAIRAHSDCRDA